MTEAPGPAGLLAAYDEQLRERAEVADALAVRRCGPLWLATFEGGRGLVTYRDLSDSTEFSRPILERSGLVKVSTTTPWIRQPARGAA